MLEQRLLVLDFRLVLESVSLVNASSLHSLAFYDKALAMNVNWNGKIYITRCIALQVTNCKNQNFSSLPRKEIIIYLGF